MCKSSLSVEIMAMLILQILVVSPDQHLFQDLSVFHIIQCLPKILHVIILAQPYQRVFPLAVLLNQKANHLYLCQELAPETK